ncbi:MAG: cytochrome c biogenesis protein CcdA [Actinobacteria bacterium]|nr:cytochrome c biogenesis protein CcdA [Actinomycetota bacterium]
MELAAVGALAFVAGLVSFTAPCTLPLLPGYVSYVSGLDDPGDANGRRAVWLGAGLFSAGFVATFTAMGATASALGWFLASRADVLNVVAGAFIVAMGLVLLGVVRVPWLRRERRADLGSMARGPGGAMPLGVAFALGWTPCIGPVLAGILATAATEASIARGAGLLFVYGLGLAAPFLWLAHAVSRGRGKLSLLRRHAPRLEKVGGALLVVMGIAVATGGWTVLMSRMLAWYGRVGWPPI